jgi:glutamyl-tRNA synthetase
MKSIDENELAVRLMPTLEQKGYNYFDITYISKVIVLLRERVKFLHEIPDFGSYMFSAPKEFDSDYKNKYWTDDTQVLLQGLLAEYKSMNEFSHDSINEVTKKYVEDKGLKLKQIIHPVRLIITGVSAGAGMFETMEVLGKDECIKRFEYFLEHHS